MEECEKLLETVIELCARYRIVTSGPEREELKKAIIVLTLKVLDLQQERIKKMHSEYMS